MLGPTANINEEYKHRLERKYHQYYEYWRDVNVAIGFLAILGVIFAAM
jgi:hypothetical protein